MLSQWQPVPALVKSCSIKKNTLSLSMCADNSIVSKNKTKHLGPVWNTSPFLGSMGGQTMSQTPPTRGRFKSPIRNNSLF